MKYFITTFLHFRLGNMSYFCSVQHRLSNMCLPVLTCLLLLQPIPLPVSNLWSSTLDPVSHIRWNQKIKLQKCLLVDNYFFEVLNNCYRKSWKFISIIVEWAARYVWYFKKQKQERSRKCGPQPLGKFREAVVCL